LSALRVKVERFAIDRQDLDLGAIANQISLQLVNKVIERVYYVTLTSPPVADDLMNLQ